MNTREKALGDFTTTWEVIPLSALAVAIGIIASGIAWALLRLIGLFTNLCYYGRWDFHLVSPAGNHLGVWAVLVPVAGSMIVGLMARFGSDRIRGHGIPEAIESILNGGSRVEPKLAILKPLSSAISIGSGGPFGAEGPIIMTGGAFGSLIAQFFHLTGAERKTLLVAGAAAGMSATFNAPISALMLAVELLLFEWKPRSVIPVAFASAAAAIARFYIIGGGALFPVAGHPAFAGVGPLAMCVIAGVLAGGLSALLTLAVYASEDGFQHVPIHWMWWPAMGGVVVGLGGLFFPQALGVGYDVIGDLVKGDRTLHLVLGVLIVKWLIWAVALGSGTSGGVLAPVMMIGAGTGALLSYALPDMGPGFWAMIGLGAMLSGTLRVPMTAIIFTVEQTHDWNMLLPLLLGCASSYAVSTLLLRRSILTEKVARRGYHVSAEYAVDPLELLYAREVMRAPEVILQAEGTIHEAAQQVRAGLSENQRLLPVVDAHGTLAGVLTRSALLKKLEEVQAGGTMLWLREFMLTEPVVAFANDPLRVVVNRMAEKGVTRMPVVEKSGRFLGLISLDDLLKARSRHLEEEQRREQTLWLPYFGPTRAVSVKSDS